MMKTSGSKRKHIINGNYSEDRNIKQKIDIEDLPVRERIKNTHEFYNGKINYGLLVRFLRNQTGKNWDDVYSETISRIPTKLLDYKEMVFWFVADKVEIIDGKIWNKRTNRFIWTPEITENGLAFEKKEFYVNPESNTLIRIECK